MASPEPGPRTASSPPATVPLRPNSAIELLFGLPPPLLSFLALASPTLPILAQLSLLLRWSHPLGPLPSWILLFIWPSLCLLIPTLLPFGFPNLFFLCLLLLGAIFHSPNPPSYSTASPRTLSSPEALLDALQAFQTLTDHLDLLSRQLAPFATLLRWTAPDRSAAACWACLTALPCSILLTHLIPLKFLVMFLGLLAILWPAEWFGRLRTLVWRSAFVRWIYRLTASLVVYAGTGFVALYRQGAHHQHSVKLWPPVVSLLSPCHPSRVQPAKDSDPQASQKPDDGQTLEFRLTIIENQRWWIGLGWIPSLAHDRPCWSDARHRPVASPANFGLPPPAHVREPHSQCQRRVQWIWRDPDWLVSPARPAPSTIRGAPDAPHGTHSDPGSLYLESEIRAECLRCLGSLQGAIESPNAGASWDVDSKGSLCSSCSDGRLDVWGQLVAKFWQEMWVWKVYSEESLVKKSCNGD